MPAFDSAAHPMTKIAALLDSAQVSGPGRQLAALGSALKCAGAELRVITFHRQGRQASPYIDYLARAAIDVDVIPESGRFDVRLVPRLHAALSAWNPDVVQTHGYKPTALVYALRARGAHWPWIAFSHGATAENSKVRFYHWLERRLLPRADRVVVMSRQQRERLSWLGDKVRILHNAAIQLPVEDHSERDVDVMTSVIPHDAAASPVIGVVGRLSPEKGVDVFLHACAELVNRGVCFLAIIVGEGPQRRDLERLSRALCLRDRVRFVGAVSAVQAVYSRLDLLVIPSRSEGLPNVLFEALGADVPVVATRVGDIPEVLEASAAGVLSAADDPIALADVIVRGLALKSDPVSRDARHTVLERFSLDRRSAAHLALYDEVLREHREGAIA
jgi:glycosyltransferase involved in cell wall biosynthesis